jgi:hypothetical protein
VQRLDQPRLGCGQQLREHGEVRAAGGADPQRCADIPAGSANVRGVIYEVDGNNQPTDRVAVSDEITSLRRGWNEVVFSTPPRLTSATNYWIGFITDTYFAYRPGRHGSSPVAGSSGSDTYSRCWSC